MRISGAASALPAHYYPQIILREAFKAYWGNRLENPRMLDRLWANAGVNGRHLVQPISAYLEMDTWGKANNTWLKAALDLGSSAICRALAKSSLNVSDVGALFFVSITGIASPSIDALLVNRMGLPLNIKRTPIFGLGCVGGAAGVARAADYVRAYPDQVAVLLSVELCSLTLQRDDLSIANQISSALFGDGAAAIVIAGSEIDSPGPRIVATRASFYPDTERVMGWDISEKGFSIVLSPTVPDVVRDNLGRDVDAFLAEHRLTRADIGCWIMHTGGPKVLRATEEALGLDESQTAASWDVLRRTGNLSSASVLLVLEDILYRRRPDPGTWSVLAAMGPGFCAEVVLLQW